MKEALLLKIVTISSLSYNRPYGSGFDRYYVESTAFYKNGKTVIITFDIRVQSRYNKYVLSLRAGDQAK
jgi:hypothetical protein